MPLKRGRIFFFGSLLIGCGIAVGLVLGEIGLRVFHTEAVLTLPHSVYHHTRPPDWTGRWRSNQGEFDQRVSFNRLGLRGSLPGDSDDRKKILVLGDSMIEALQVSEEETFCGQLEDNIEGDYSILNAGIGGYSPILMLLRLPELLKEFGPEIVLVALFPNDLEEELVYRKIGAANASRRVEAVPAPVLGSRAGRIQTVLFRHLAIWRLVSRSTRQETIVPNHKIDPSSPPSNVVYPFREGWTPVEKEAWSAVFTSLGEIQMLCRDAGIRVVLLLVPPGQQVSLDVWKSGKQLMGYGPGDWVESETFQKEALLRARRIDLEAIDLLPSFKDHPNPTSLYFDHDGHWTAEGNAFAAEKVGEFLRNYQGDPGKPESSD